MIGTSTIELIFIRVSITLLRSITPLSILYCLSLPFLPQRRLFYVVAAWPIAETAFYFLLYLPRERSLQRAAQHPPFAGNLSPPRRPKRPLAQPSLRHTFHRTHRPLRSAHCESILAHHHLQERKSAWCSVAHSKNDLAGVPVISATVEVT